MDINRNNLDTIFRNLRTDFRGAYEIKEDLNIDTFANQIPMTSASMRFDFLGDNPEFREWVGPRKAQEYASQNYSVTYKDWELTIKMKARDIMDDNIGLYSIQAKGGGESARLLKPREVFKALNDGTSRLCYDGQNFFDTDHPVGESGDETTAVNYYNIGGASVASPWYLMDVSRVVKPLLWLNRQDPEFQSFQDYTNMHTFTLNEFLFGGHAYGAAHYGLWQSAARNEGLLCAENLRAMRLDMNNLTANRKNEDGTRRKLGIEPTLLVFGAANRDRANILMNNPQISTFTGDVLTPGATDTAKQNPVYKAFTPVYVSWLP